MAKLEDLKQNMTVKGVLPNGLVTVINVDWIGDFSINLTYRDSEGNLGNELLYRDRETTIEIMDEGAPWTYNGDGAMFRLVSEAYRIKLAYIFDPYLAVHTSLVEPLPHQITAVYGEMIPRQPLRFILADDPGAGKTIMTGLLIKELHARGDLQRCLIVSPGNLVEQWQDEMYNRFHVPFEIMTNDKLESARTGNWFNENPFAICRLDKLSRDEDIQAKLRATEWDLVVCDEAHKMSAHFFGGELKYTKRYRLGQLLSSVTRHFLLLTATPHNGKEEDFQLFMALIDPDRFEGRFRDGVHTSDTTDLMRRLVKEQLVRFDGTPLFPERIAYTVNYTLSEAENELYEQVTEYVRQEFNRADNLGNEGRRGTVGFALTVLQRRLASSPEAIYQSLKRRRERLEKRLHEIQTGRFSDIDINSPINGFDIEDFEDLDDAPDEEIEALEEIVVDQASASRTIEELQIEIDILRRLERAALLVKQSGTDRKWDELSRILQNRKEMFDAGGNRRKLIIFTEHKDTLNYLYNKITSLLGRHEAVEIIHGAIRREQRKTAEQRFTQDKDVEVLIATDAAGEGINLQRAHLMVNYDLPWNPNRLEQRFGRIHRIGQTEVCHLWNLVARETREGDVYGRLLEKLDRERDALGGQVFDVLGRITFEDRSLRDLLMEAVRYGDRPDVKAKLYQVVDGALDHDHIQELLEERALARDSMDTSKVMRIREEMERADARRLQPHFIASFFIEALKHLGGTARERERRRYELTHVPAAIRIKSKTIGTREPVLTKYERITFEKDLMNLQGKPMAQLVCPGHPILDVTIDAILEKHRDLLRCGTMLVDQNDPGEDIRILVFLEHAIQDARPTGHGRRHVVSRQMQFVEMLPDGSVKSAGYAPYLDYRPVDSHETALLRSVTLPEWIHCNVEKKVMTYAAQHLVPEHLHDVKQRTENLVGRTMVAVQNRLTTEIAYWDRRAEELKEQELAGKVNARINSGKARLRADELDARLKRRIAELEEEKKLSPLPPVVLGGALILPVGFFEKMEEKSTSPAMFARDTKRVEMAAMNAVMEAEKDLGYVPKDVSAQKVGYDIESSVPGTGKLRFIEVKGRVQGAATVTVTRREILTALNKPDDFILALVEVDGDSATPRYVRNPFQREPDFAANSVNYELRELIQKSTEPN
ncbi:MAG TPA: helicase-related protein [Spirochaetota bacterium]|nr:helicase-related protein [Spirochaetota bacterium]